MASSMSMTASLLPSSSTTVTRLPSAAARRGLIVAKASRADNGEKATCEEPKAGTPEAKKKFAPVCVTMPTASICRK
ncbi:hypothetical protein DITRI_Ditri05aG0090800 [Diplodiscus trichospermus]